MTHKVRGKMLATNLIGGYDGTVEESETSFTIATRLHQYKFVRATNAGAIAVTIPANLNWKDGDWTQIVQGGAGAVTVTGASGVTVNGTDGGEKATTAAYGALHIRCIGNNEFMIL